MLFIFSMQFCNGYTYSKYMAHSYNNEFLSDNIKVLHCVKEDGKVFQTEHVLGTKKLHCFEHMTQHTTG